MANRRDNDSELQKITRKKDVPEEADMIREPQAAYGQEAMGPYTVDDYMKLPEDVRVELIDGYFYDMASALPLHQQILGQLYLQIYNCIEKSGRQCEVYLAPSDVQLDCDKYTVVQPDLYVICELQDPKQHAYQGAPAFVAEVLSPSNRAHDLIRKRYKYKNAGVQEYWVIDPENRVVLVYDFAHGNPVEEYSFTDTIPIAISDGACKVDFAKIDESVARYGYR